ncbi:MAG: cysteine desulfurase family protein [Paracoccaceae bacterium]
MSGRVYLDWNASAPLCAAAKAAIIRATDVVGNPSSVHGAGRAAKNLVETARKQVSDAFGVSNGDVVFTSGATEAAAIALAGRNLTCSPVEHDAVLAWCTQNLITDAAGQILAPEPAKNCVQMANGETGIVQHLPLGLAVCDATQAFGKIPLDFDSLGCEMAVISAHKFGGPTGVGALVLKKGLDVVARNRGGGQEMGRRSGTENLIGIAGFGAAAQSAVKDVKDGIWEQVKVLRDRMEAAMLTSVPSARVIGDQANRLPNTSCIITPDWKGETQVMALDLAGFSISAGSACSSGKVKPSLVLQAMGVSAQASQCAIRVSLGPDTTEAEVMKFADAWAQAQKRYVAKAA